MLNIEHLTKTYGEKKAVDDLNLHIRPGEIYGFIGHNGAGKTTTLKSVAGILQFDAGEIYIGGDSVREKPLECKRKIAYIPDNPDLYEYMTGIRYLNFIADIFGVDAALRRERIRRYADAFELTGDLAQPIAAYSHGMKQKLAIIAAWLHEPQLILMDEPFVGLDPKAAHLLKGMMREICDRGGAIFFSTNAQRAAVAQGDVVDIAFTPQINEYRSVRSVQLNLVDIRPDKAFREAQGHDRAVYKKHLAGGELSCDEAECLLPTRQDFVAVWRYLAAFSQGGVLSEELGCLSRKISRCAKLSLSAGKTRICLDVLAEQGLLQLEQRPKSLCIRLCADGRKVDLEKSPILIHLKKQKAGT